MAEKKLQIELPPIIGYLHHAYHLSVARLHPSFNEWFNSNYIQLKYYPKTGWLNFFFLKFELYPLIDWRSVKSEVIITNKIDIISFIINCINAGYYVWLYIDGFYDPNNFSYNIKHHVHECMIFGYNTDKRCLYLAGFNTQQNYSFFEITYSDFIKAFSNTDINTPVMMLNPKETDSYKFDMQNVIELLEDYIYSKNTSERIRMFLNPTSDAIYGIEIYKYLKKNFEDPPWKEYLHDIRPLHILWEHKKCMASRIKFLYDNKYLDNLDSFYSNYKKIEKKVLTLRNMQLKYRTANNDDIIKKIIAYIDEIYAEEKEILAELLKCIR